MKLYGNLTQFEDGIPRSIQGMMTQVNVMGILSENITKFGVVGYQRTEPHISSFAEYIGSAAVEGVKDTQVGRIRLTGNPLDLALNSKTYFQVKQNGEILNTKDGQFKLNKNGYLLTMQNGQVLSDQGTPLQFKSIPLDLNDVNIDASGMVSYLDRHKNIMVQVGKLSVVHEDGTFAGEPDVKQKHLEDSNVTLAKEFFDLIPLRRNFEANRQMFIIQNDTYSKTIQELGKSQ